MHRQIVDFLSKPIFSDYVIGLLFLIDHYVSKIKVAEISDKANVVDKTYTNRNKIG